MTNAQVVVNTATPIEAEIFTIVEEPAEFPGGAQAMMAFLSKNIKYPESCRNLFFGGKVFLKFVVNEDGSITNTDILKSSGFSEMDDEAVRVLKMMPFWKPAKMTGKPVKCYFNLPVSFAMDEPFYIFNQSNNNADYQRIMRLITNGYMNEALVQFEQFSTQDVELMYTIAVLKFHSNQKQEACSLFQKLIQNNNSVTSVFNNSKRFYQQYCN